MTIEYGGDIFGEFELPASELYGLIAAMIILILAFGSVLAMGLPIGTAVVGLATGAGLVTIFSHVLSMPDFTVQMAAMIGLGVGIDYALFIVQRFREGLDHGLEVQASIVEAIDTSGRAVLFAGTAVLISLCGMFLMGLAFMNGLAIGAIARRADDDGGLAHAAAGVPRVLGRRVNETSRAALDRRDGLHHRVDRRCRAVEPGTVPRCAVLAVVVYALSFIVKSWRTPLPHRAQKPPRAGASGTSGRASCSIARGRCSSQASAILGFLTIPLFSIRLGFGDTGNLPETQTARRGYDMLAEGFGPGIGGRTVITVAGPAASDQATLHAFTAQLAATEGVAASPPPVVIQLTPDLAIVQLYPSTSPQDKATTQLVQRLRDDVIPASGLDARVGGAAAGAIDFSHLHRRQASIPDRSRADPVVHPADGRLQIAARTAQGGDPQPDVDRRRLRRARRRVPVGHGKTLIGVDKNGPIEAWIPMMMFAIVFGLSMDYEVFLLSRIKEHYDKTRDNAVAVADGVAVTARVITAAALIMVCVFLSFVIGDDRSLKMFGLGLAVAVADRRHSGPHVARAGDDGTAR